MTLPVEFFIPWGHMSCFEKIVPDRFRRLLDRHKQSKKNGFNVKLWRSNADYKFSIILLRRFQKVKKVKILKLTYWHVTHVFVSMVHVKYVNFDIPS